MYPLLRPLAFALPAETAHHLGLGALELLSAAPDVCARLRSRARTQMDLSVSFAGLTFPNPIGLAAGLDKDGQAIPGLFALGFGAIEVGTVTPRPQPGNPKPRLFRIPSERALINRMGFNNLGMEEMAARLRELSFKPAPLGVNLGKNWDTPLERAVEDYQRGAEFLGPLADYVVVNASSPNTPGLRKLQEPEALGQLLRRTRAALPSGKPLFLKISPDLSFEAIDQVVEVARASGADGIIATNTTIERPTLLQGQGQGERGVLSRQRRWFNEPGGLSGAPLREKSTAVIRRIFQTSKGTLPIIGVGGVFTAEDAYEKIRAGASLVQVYTGFIYQGPRMVKKLLTGLERLLQRDGLTHIRDSMGVGAA